ncbi:unnamed protein product [Arabidopsis lyrata]|uniref:Uncharacterized protein n=1 Tax=Arabidopsis lyrata subsp. lyrata TaxID=81972 RepID=D7M084_ARALL|nr:defensin-like protein 151 [Arabidopsis lyrata subsp. lyrata]EFH48873.1 hypothetical protein ARALYDRAFT_911530 [Arabidopsis lyrata subsp. lyrata]CAH8273008.1 unnamed protein product [Arabidopsis lyrata]|eukprot:XP_002872614.1 defensin-like protein 151 [Arabidopsis lyrata subsp. lyrata]
MKKPSQLSATILTIFTILAIGVMVKETVGQAPHNCVEILKEASKGATCDAKLCASQCRQKFPAAGGFGECNSNRGQVECQCKFYCKSDGSPITN